MIIDWRERGCDDRDREDGDVMDLCEKVVYKLACRKLRVHVNDSKRADICFYHTVYVINIVLTVRISSANPESFCSLWTQQSD